MRLINFIEVILMTIAFLLVLTVLWTDRSPEIVVRADRDVHKAPVRSVATTASRHGMAG